MAFKTAAQIAQTKIDQGYIPGRCEDYFSPPHGSQPMHGGYGKRAPSDEAVHAATVRYVEQEKRGELRDLPRRAPTHRPWVQR